MRFLYIILTIFLIDLANAQMGIERRFNGQIATDLFYKNAPLPAQLAFRLYQEYQGEFDLSLLDPNPNTDLWQSTPYHEKQDIPIHYMDHITFHSNFLSANGLHRFNAETSTGLYTLYIGKHVHSVLMRRELLVKLGYKMPPVKRLKKVVINFIDEAQKDHFIRLLSENTLSDPENRWIVKNEATQLIVQDIIATLPVEAVHNFSFGLIDRSLIRGRRLLNSLLVPFNLVYFQESVNQMSWSSGRIISEKVYLPYPDSDEFTTTWEDARWITRKILTLSRADWIEVVNASQTPADVKAILLEKILARRNSLAQLFKLETVDFEINSNISNGDNLIEGKLVLNDWAGYGSRFAHGDPESPLSSSEITSFIKSKALSSAIDVAVNAINAIPMLGTDIQAKNQAEIDKIVAQALADGIGQGGASQIPVKSWIFPVAQARLILNRNIVAGNYLGTNNIIQLVDTIGVSTSAGMYMGIAGLPQPLAGVGVSALGNFNRIYAHVRPISSVQKSLKYSFKNMAVPLLKRKYGKVFEEVLNDEFLSLSEELQREKIEQALDLFKNELEIGESLLITDSLSAGINGVAGANLMPWLSAQVGAGANQLFLSRLHIHRKSENEIQVYKDFGNMGSININLGLNAGIPVIRGSANFNRGRAKTDFYKVSINQNENLQLVEYISALKNILFTNSLSQLKGLQKPWRMQHKFNETDARLGIFTLRMNHIKNNTYMSLTAPNGELKNFYRSYNGKTIGNDYQTYAKELIEFLAGKALNQNVNATAMQHGGNPGNSFFGKARNRISSFEAEIQAGGLLIKPFVQVTRLWNGWRMKQSQAKKLLQKVRIDYNFRFFSPDLLNDTKRLFLYNISLNFLFFEEAIDHILSSEEDKVRQIFRRHNQKGLFGIQTDDRRIGNGFNLFIKHRNKAMELRETNKWQAFSKSLIKMFEVAENRLTVEGLKQLCGDEKYLYIVGRIDGFRDGNEDANNHFDYYTNPYISHSVGDFGAIGPQRSASPLTHYIQHTGMTFGEFYAHWLMGQAL
jgi:hypothetical protein